MATFGARDLALLLPDKVGETISYSDKSDKFEPLVPKIDATKKVLRYRAGQTPMWVPTAADGASGEVQLEDRFDASVSSESLSSANIITHPSAPVVDRRLARLSKPDASSSSSSRGSTSAAPEEPVRRRRVYEAEVIVEAPESQVEHMSSLHEGKEFAPVSDEDEDDEEAAVELMRQRRARALMQQQQPSTTSSSSLKKKAQSSSDDGSSSSEEDSESESESEDETRPKIRPVFVPKHMRETVKQRELEEQLELEKLSKKSQVCIHICMYVCISYMYFNV